MAKDPKRIKLVRWFDNRKDVHTILYLVGRFLTRGEKLRLALCSKTTYDIVMSPNMWPKHHTISYGDEPFIRTLKYLHPQSLRVNVGHNDIPRGKLRCVWRLRTLVDLRIDFRFISVDTRSLRKISRLKELESVCLTGASGVQSWFLDYISPDLKSLEIRDAPTAKFERGELTRFKNLESLRIMDTRDEFPVFRDISHLSKLKRLTVKCKGYSDEDVSCVLNTVGRQLEWLELDCSGMESLDSLKALSGSINLELLSLTKIPRDTSLIEIVNSLPSLRFFFFTQREYTLVFAKKVFNSIEPSRLRCIGGCIDSDRGYSYIPKLTRFTRVSTVILPYWSHYKIDSITRSFPFPFTIVNVEHRSLKKLRCLACKPRNPSLAWRYQRFKMHPEPIQNIITAYISSDLHVHTSRAVKYGNAILVKVYRFEVVITNLAIQGLSPELFVVTDEKGRCVPMEGSPLDRGYTVINVLRRCSRGLSEYILRTINVATQHRVNSERPHFSEVAEAFKDATNEIIELLTNNDFP